MFNILSQPTAYDRPFPKIGCGLKFCFEEDDYIVTAGTASDIEIVIGLFALVVAGDTMTIDDYNFTFVSGTPTNLQEIQIGVGAATATNLFTALNQIPYFIDKYIIDNSIGFIVQLTSIDLAFNGAYDFEATTTNVSAVIINPFSTPTQGTDPVLKEEYYVLMDIIDVDTGEKVCMDALNKPINVFSSGNPKACFDLQPILARYPYIFTAPPLPYQPVLQGTGRPDNFDDNYIRRFSIRVWNSYKDPNSAANCDKVQSGFFELPSIVGLDIEVANFIQKETECSANGFFYYSYPNFGKTQKWITVMPESYQICQNTATELRFEYDVQTINALGGDVYMNLTVHFTDGTFINNITQWDRLTTGVQVANLSFGFGTVGNHTIQLPILFAGKKIDRVDISLFHIVFATTFYLMEDRTLYFNHEVNAKVKCCDNHSHFYFLSTVGNNDVIIGKETDIDLEVEFFEVCREQKCCGTEYYGTKQYNSGMVNAALKSDSKVYKTLIEASGDYLDEFLLSPFKWLYEQETDSLFSIVPTKGSFKIWQKNKRNVVEFTYKKSLIRKHFML
jgi:hypothetical protein